MKQIFINEQTCIGCHLGEVYCRLKHARSRNASPGHPPALLG